MFDSSSSVESLNSKPLNPFALSFTPRPNEAITELYFPCQLPPMMDHPEGETDVGFFFAQSHFPSYSFTSYSSFSCYFPAYFPSEFRDYKVESVRMYIPDKQQPFVKSQTNVRNKRKGKRVILPPRLRQPPKESDMNRLVYVPKNPVDKKIEAEADFQLEGKTSLMIKNVPNHLRRSDLRRMLDQHCRVENSKSRSRASMSQSAYDFLYLPMDFGFGLNLGFAFVNFTTSEAALSFFQAFNDREWKCPQSRKKICEITTAKIQGKEGLKQQFEKSSFPCHSNEYLPVLFSPPRNGFNCSRPILVGRRTHFSATTEKVMIMTKRKNRKA